MNPYIKLLRIKAWYAFFLLAFFGFIVSRGNFDQLSDVLVFVLMISAYLGFSFAINNTFDVREDRLKEARKNPLATREITHSKALAFSLLLALSGLLLSVWFGLVMFVYHTSLTLLSLFYSVPPVRLKSRCPLDILSHGFFFGSLIFVQPVLIFSSFTLDILLISISIFILSMAIELWNHIIDFDSDLKARLRTTVCVIGLNKSERFARILAMIFPLTFLPMLHRDWYFLVFIAATSTYILIYLKGLFPPLLYSSEATVLYMYAIFLYGLILVSVIIGS